MTKGIGRSILGFQNNNRGNRVGRRCGQLKNKTLTALHRLERGLRTRQEITPLKTLTESWYMKTAVRRPIKHVQIDPARLAGGSPKLKLSSKWAGGSAVDRLAIRLHPFAYFSQTFDAGTGNLALGCWTNIQQVISSLPGDVDEVANDSFRGLPFVVIKLKTPGRVHCHTAFPVDTR